MEKYISDIIRWAEVCIEQINTFYRHDKPNIWFCFSDFVGPRVSVRTEEIFELRNKEDNRYEEYCSVIHVFDSMDLMSENLLETLIIELANHFSKPEEKFEKIVYRGNYYIDYKLVDSNIMISLAINESSMKRVSNVFDKETQIKKLSLE